MLLYGFELKVNCNISKQLNAFIFISVIPMQREKTAGSFICSIVLKARRLYCTKKTYTLEN